MNNKELRLNLARLLGASAISIIAGLVGRKIVHKVHRSRFKKHEDLKLDVALEQSMDCSDPVGTY